MSSGLWILLLLFLKEFLRMADSDCILNSARWLHADFFIHVTHDHASRVEGWANKVLVLLHRGYSNRFKVLIVFGETLFMFPTSCHVTLAMQNMRTIRMLWFEKNYIPSNSSECFPPGWIFYAYKQDATHTCETIIKTISNTPSFFKFSKQFTIISLFLTADFDNSGITGRFPETMFNCKD